MKQDVLRKLILDVFEAGWYERNRRTSADGKIETIPIDSDYQAAERAIVGKWFAELTKDTEF